MAHNLCSTFSYRLEISGNISVYLMIWDDLGQFVQLSYIKDSRGTVDIVSLMKMWLSPHLNST